MFSKGHTTSCICLKAPLVFKSDWRWFMIRYPLEQCFSTTVRRHTSVLWDNERRAVKNGPISLNWRKKNWLYFKINVSLFYSQDISFVRNYTDPGFKHWGSINRLPEYNVIIRLKCVILCAMGFFSMWLKEGGVTQLYTIGGQTSAGPQENFKSSKGHIACGP